MLSRIVRRYLVAAWTKNPESAYSDALWQEAVSGIRYIQTAVADIRASDPATPEGERRLTKYTDDLSDPLWNFAQLEGWVRAAFGASTLDDLWKARPQESALIEAVTETKDLNEFLVQLSYFQDKVQHLLKQAAPEKFTYLGFNILNPNRLGDKVVLSLLTGLPATIKLFKERGMGDLLSDALRSIVVNRSVGTFQETGRNVGGYYSSQDRTLALPTDSPNIWKTFLHELGHYVHLTYIKGEAREFWDQTWNPIKEMKRSLGYVTQSDIGKFYALLVKDEFDPAKTARRLKGMDRVRFAYWLRHPTMNDSLITPKQFRLTPHGAAVFKVLQNPEQYVEDSYGYKPGEPKFEEYVSRAIERKKDVLGVGIGDLPLSVDLVHELEADPAIRETVEQMYADLGVPTEYGKNDEVEDFAETFWLFMTAPEKLSENALYRMKRTLWLSGFGGKPVMRLAGISDDPQKWQYKTEQWVKRDRARSRKNKGFKGVTLHWDPNGDDTAFIRAVTEDERVVGDLFYGIQDDARPDILEGAVEVHPDFRRQGLASAMYSWAEQLSGKKFAPADSHTPLAEAMRPFGRQARAIPLDKHRIKELSRELQAVIKQQTRGLEAWAPLGKRVLVSGAPYSIRAVDGSEVDLFVRLQAVDSASKLYVVSGGFGHDSRKRPVVIVNLNANIFAETYFKSAQGCSLIADMIYPVLLHELTHAADIFSKGVASEMSQDEASGNAVYYNNPGEVRAYLQEILHEIETGALLRALPKLKQTFGSNRAVHFVLKNSDTWKEIEKYLTERNKRLVMKAVGQKIEESSEFQQQVKTAARRMKLWRAAQDDIIIDLACFAVDRSDAEAYLDNPGFGGPNLYYAYVTPKKVLDLFEERRPMPVLLEAAGLDPEADDPGGVDVDEYVHRNRMADRLIKEGYTWVRLRDSYPAGAETWTWLGSSREEEPEMIEVEQKEASAARRIVARYLEAKGTSRGWEHRKEKDEFSENNIPAEHLLLWRKLKKQFKGTPDQRAEQFMEYLAEHPGESDELLQQNADKEVAKMLREWEKEHREKEKREKECDKNQTKYEEAWYKEQERSKQEKDKLKQLKEKADGACQLSPAHEKSNDDLEDLPFA